MIALLLGMLLLGSSLGLSMVESEGVVAMADTGIRGGAPVDPGSSAPGGHKPAVRPPAPATAITVTGHLIEGTECAAMRGDDGLVYSLLRSVDAPLGTRLRVTGDIQPVSFCQQGTTIAVSQLELLP